MGSELAEGSEYALSMDKVAEINRQPSAELRVFLAAKEYVKCGFYVLPIMPNKKILPRKDYGVTYSNASKNIKTITGWFDPYEGRFAGWNIGIAGGRSDGVFIVDVDNHEEKNGFIAMEAATEEYGPLPDGPCQSTPNGGGKHYLFRWQEHAANTTDKVGYGIDTRGGTEHSCKGHVVVWPSTVDGKKYKWEMGGVVPVVPRWIMERMGVLWRNKQFSGGGGRGNENVEESDLEVKLDLEQIERMLGSISPDALSYDEWLKVGMSIKSQHGGEEGLSLWDKWSSGGPRYEKGECTIRWEGLDPCGAVRAGTLFFVAREHGWEADKEAGDKSGNKFDIVVAAMNEEYAIVAVGGKIKILREKEILSGSCESSFDLMDKDSFKTLLMNDKVWIKTGEKEKPISTADIWLAHEDRRTFANGMGLYPRIETPPGYFNTWKGFAVEPKIGSCELFLSHIKNIICGRVENYYEWIMDWMADLVQDPSNPKGCAIVLRGDEGVGKGTMANAIGELFGPHYKHLIDDSHLTSNFNGHLLDAVVVFADEITWGGNKKTAGKLKGMVTEKNLLGERKGVDAVVYRNMIHMMIASNSEWVIPAGRNSRRWFVLDVLPAKVGNGGYFNSIQDEMDNGGKAALLQMLLERDITSNLRIAPETEALDRQRQLSVVYSTPVLWWSRCVISEKIETPDEKEFNPESAQSSWPDIVAKDSLHSEYEQWCIVRKERPVHYNMFCSELKLIGVAQTRPTVNKKRLRVFSIPSIPEARRLLLAEHPRIIEGE